MAMLRNLRNLILSGVSHRHHGWAISKLNNENVRISLSLSLAVAAVVAVPVALAVCAYRAAGGGELAPVSVRLLLGVRGDQHRHREAQGGGPAGQGGGEAEP